MRFRLQVAEHGAVKGGRIVARYSVQVYLRFSLQHAAPPLTRGLLLQGYDDKLRRPKVQWSVCLRLGLCVQHRTHQEQSYPTLVFHKGCLAKYRTTEQMLYMPRRRRDVDLLYLLVVCLNGQRQHVKLS